MVLVVASGHFRVIVLYWLDIVCMPFMTTFLRTLISKFQQKRLIRTLKVSYQLTRVYNFYNVLLKHQIDWKMKDYDEGIVLKMLYATYMYTYIHNWYWNTQGQYLSSKFNILIELFCECIECFMYELMFIFFPPSGIGVPEVLPDNTLVQEGASIRLLCQVDASSYGRLKVMWLKGGIPLLSETPRLVWIKSKFLQSFPDWKKFHTFVEWKILILQANCIFSSVNSYLTSLIWITVISQCTSMQFAADEAHYLYFK